MPLNEYRSARAEAEHLAALMRTALLCAGLRERDVSHVRPVVTGSGRAYIDLGALPVAAANKLLDALPLAEPADASTPPADAFG